MLNSGVVSAVNVPIIYSWLACDFQKPLLMEIGAKLVVGAINRACVSLYQMGVNCMGGWDLGIEVPADEERNASTFIKGKTTRQKELLQIYPYKLKIFCFYDIINSDFLKLTGIRKGGHPWL